MAHIFKTLPAVAVLAALTTTATFAIGSHSGNPGGGSGGGGTGAITTYEYARYCLGNSNDAKDSTESFVTISGSGHVKGTTALVLTTVANGNSLPYAFIGNPATPTFVSLDFDALGVDNNSFGNAIFADNDGLFNAAIWDLKGSQKTKPLATTPSGYTHYRLTPGNANGFDGPTLGNKATIVSGSIGEFPNKNATLSIANIGLNSPVNGAPNVTIVTTASVADCVDIDLP